MKIEIINNVKHIIADEGKVLVNGIDEFEVYMTELYTDIDDDRWCEIDTPISE